VIDYEQDCLRMRMRNDLRGRTVGANSKAFSSSNVLFCPLTLTKSFIDLILHLKYDYSTKTA
jgi:hypothetical protein